MGSPISRKKAVDSSIKAEVWKHVFDLIPEGISIHSPDGRVLQANRKLAATYGREADDIFGRHCATVFHVDGSRCGLEARVKSGAAGSFREMVSVGDRRFAVSIEAFYEKGEVAGYVRITRDITERHRTREQLLAAERFATLGQMISGIAHDIGTPLNIISGYSEYLLMRTNPDAQGYKEISTILKQARRIVGFIQQMLDLARPAQGRSDAIRIREFLVESLDLMGHELRKMDGKASVICRTDAAMIYGDAPRLRQAFFNLLLNASQCAGPGSTLELVIDQPAGYDGDLVVMISSLKADGSGHDFSTSFAGFLRVGDSDEVLGMGLSLAKEIFQGFGTVVSTLDMAERGKALVLRFARGGRGAAFG